MENTVNNILENSGLWMDLGGIMDYFFNFNFSCCVVAKRGVVIHEKEKHLVLFIGIFIRQCVLSKL